MSRPVPQPVSQPDDLLRRVEAVEQQGAEHHQAIAELRKQVAQIAADAAAARTLAAAVDQDVSMIRVEVRGHTRVLNALREDQLALRTDFTAFRTEMYGFRAEMYGFRTEMHSFRDETRKALATLGAGTARVVTLLEGISAAP